MITIKRNLNTVLTVNTPSASSDYARTLMGDEAVTLVWEQPTFTALQVGDHIMHDGAKFTLNALPTVKKLSTKLFQYNAVFQSPIYDLAKANYMLFDNTPTAPQGEFSLTGTPDTFLTLLVANLNRVFGAGTWAKGQVLTAEVKTLTFSSESCHSVLARLADEFETEYSLTGNAVNLIEITNPANLTLEYGSTLYDVERKSIDSSSVITRLYPFGSNKNIAADYRSGSAKLLLPHPLQCLEANTSLYGTIEGQKTFDDIYPRLNPAANTGGSVTGIGSNVFSFSDTKLNFNVNSYLMPGTPAKLRFLTGDCAGYDLEIKKYDGWLFTVLPNESDKGFSIPNSAIFPAIGDKYVLLDIIMPPAYVAAAEAELQAKAEEYLSENSHPKVAYSVTFSAIWAKLNAPDLKPGDLVTVFDADLGIDADLRVVKINKGITDAENVKVDLSDTVSKTTLTRIADELAANTQGVTKANEGIRQQFARNWRNVEELSTMIDTLRTDMLFVGNVQGQFDISGTLFTPNYQNDKNKFYATAGTLRHKTIPTDESPGTWTLPAYAPTLAADSTPYYLYARCNRANGAGVYYISASALVYDADPTYYYFLVGVISSVVSGVRTLQTTYGFTQITGKSLVTGTIQSADGSTSFNLDTGEIAGNIKFKSGGTYKDVGTGISEAQTDAEADATAKANAAQTTAQTYALAQAQLAETTAKAYADGIVDDEEARAIADATAKAEAARVAAVAAAEADATAKANAAQSTAQTYALAQAQLAETTAKAHADGIVDAEEARAIADATAKAEAARVAAVAAAEADATAKANAAKSYAEQLTNNNVADYNAKIATLQSQVDGEVSNWFFPYVPTIGAFPVTQWTTNSEKDAHIGDTFTNTQQFVDNASTPNAGKSWRFLKDAGVYSWAVIADSDAVLALQKAATAQSTADGKSTTYLVQPTKYRKGDVWILSSDWNGFKSGEMLNASTDSDAFNSSHWSKAVKYTDDTAVDNLIISGRNLLLNSNPNKTSSDYYITYLLYGVEKPKTSETYSIALKGTLNDASLNGFLVNIMDAAGYRDIVRLYESDKGSDGVYRKTFEMPALSGDALYSYIYALPLGLSKSATLEWVTLVKGDKPTLDHVPAPEDVQIQIDNSNALLSDIASDDKITPNDKSRLINDYNVILAEKPLNVTQATNIGVGYSNYEAKYNSLVAYVGTNLNNLTTTWDLGSGGGVTLKTKFSDYYTARTNLQNLISATAKQAADEAYNYADDAYNEASTANYNLTNMVVGGENLITNSNFELTALSGDNFAHKVLRGSASATAVTPSPYFMNGKTYVFSAEKVEKIAGTATAVTLKLFDFTTNGSTQNLDTILNLSTSKQTKIFTVPNTGNWSLIIYGGKGGSTAYNTIKFTNLMCQVGNKATAYKTSMEYLAEAFQNDDIELSNDTQFNMTMMKMLRLRDTHGNVRGGMSGLDGDNVGMWTGGTYQNALDGLAKTILRKDGSGQLAGGNISWGVDGNLLVKGAIEALSGKIAGLTISEGAMMSDTITISDAPVETLAGLAGTPFTLNLARQASWTAIQSATGGVFATATSQNFTLASDANIVLRAYTAGTGTYKTGALEIRRASDDSLVWRPFAPTTELHDLNYSTGLSAGTYYIYVQSYAYQSGGGTATARAYISGLAANPDVIKVTGLISKTRIGNDGFFSFWNANKYLYFSELFGLSARGATDIPAGLGGASINSGGGIFANWGKIDSTGKVVKSGSNYTITHNIGDTNYSLILTPISTNMPYISSAKSANSVVVTCAGGFDFVLIRTQ